MTLIDLKRAIMGVLKNEYPNNTLYAESLPTGFKRPSFYIYFVPLESEHNSRLFIEKATMIKIDYYSENRTNEENWIMADELESIFHNDLKVKDRFFSVTRTTSETLDDVLTFTLTVDYETGGVNIIKVDDDDFIEENNNIGYTEGKVKLMTYLEME